MTFVRKIRAFNVDEIDKRKDKLWILTTLCYTFESKVETNIRIDKRNHYEDPFVTVSQFKLRFLKQTSIKQSEFVVMNWRNTLLQISKYLISRAILL